MAEKEQKTSSMFLLRAQVPGKLNADLRKLSKETGISFSKLVEIAIDQLISGGAINISLTPVK